MSPEGAPRPEQREAVELADISYFLVEDNIGVSQEVQASLVDPTGPMLDQKDTIEGALKRLAELVTSDKTPDIIILDRQIPRREGSKAPEDKGGDQFIKKFAEYQKRPEVQGRLDNIAIVLHSTHASNQSWVNEMKIVSPSVVGGIDKNVLNSDGPEAFASHLKGLLQEAGIVKKDS